MTPKSSCGQSSRSTTKELWASRFVTVTSGEPTTSTRNILPWEPARRGTVSGFQRTTEPWNRSRCRPSFRELKKPRLNLRSVNTGVRSSERTSSWTRRNGYPLAGICPNAGVPSTSARGLPTLAPKVPPSERFRRQPPRTESVRSPRTCQEVPAAVVGTKNSRPATSNATRCAALTLSGKACGNLARPAEVRAHAEDCRPAKYLADASYAKDRSCTSQSQRNDPSTWSPRITWSPALLTIPRADPSGTKL